MKEKVMGLKRTVMFITTVIILLATTLSFYYIWDKYYSETIIIPFYKKGNFLMVALKRTVMFITTVIILLATTLSFYYIWDKYYSETIIIPFYKKGNFLMVALYCLLLYIFTKIYNGYKVGFLKLSEIIYSQVISMMFVNCITYIQISLIGRAFLLYMG